jgi:hypothetical protein
MDRQTGLEVGRFRRPVFLLVIPLQAIAEWNRSSTTSLNQPSIDPAKEVRFAFASPSPW